MSIDSPAGANEQLGLPRAKMKPVVIAFDIDGTLRCNCTPTCRDANERMVILVRLLGHMKNTRLIAWSGGGASYAREFVRLYKLDSYIPEKRCYSKLACPELVDIAVDDIQDTALGLVNLIVREK